MPKRVEREEGGTFLQYREHNFKPDTLVLIHACNEIIEKYEGKGLTLTLRQLYYQCVSRNMLPNTLNSYKRLGEVLDNGRMAGLVSWTALEDRNRSLMGYNTHNGPGAAIKSLLATYKIDAWANQEWRPEVWVEKQAMESVIGQISNQLRVDFYATKGYDSQSQSWRAGQRFAGYIRKGQRPIVFHLGDHDPSGVHMTVDLRERLERFTGTPVIVERLSLNMTQIKQYEPPPNVAKETDSRFGQYVLETGTRSSWELDALDPEVIMDLIRDAVLRIRDPDRWRDAMAQEEEDKAVLAETAEHL